jgi:hypothetical protein
MSDHENEGPRLRRERTVPLNVPIPYPLRNRLDELLDELDLAGAETTLKELVALVIFHAEEDRAKLFQLWVDYRNAAPEDAALGTPQPGQVIPFRQPRIGRPRKNA